MVQNEFYCTVIYPITVTKQMIETVSGLSWEQFQSLSEDSKKSIIVDLAEQVRINSEIAPLITECLDEELND